MLNRIQGFNNDMRMSNFNNMNSRNCNFNSGAFEIMLITLLTALKEQNKVTRNEQEKTLNRSVNTLNRMNFTSQKLGVSVDERIENAIAISAKKYGVDEKLVKAIIKIESNFDPKVVSLAGAKGLMQLMPENCRDLGISDPFNIEQNIDGGVRHIKEYLDRYNGDMEMALMAYNGGPTRMINRGVRSMNDIYKMPKETQNYVPKVMSYYRGL
ncbi:Transglycosylase SLT domain-containing protein [Clostridium cadaveris]|uniref:Transglycosylase SLT domain-containing protein n=1 Tax=Clostridium cadaveris TaxID=1529 RepID=A0A1I2LXT8_9CLOT|nr:lytic transglycosylase domain-containing protein [Clostridium cadaveris]MDM8313389.1 lytic transglycosylase domain-containing protein [Clostridium cadaveris]SFF84043.1 Transglycosylase SLT domain-containing protein [Clostridium cadaveris]